MKPDVFVNRKYLIIGFISIAMVVIILRLFDMQILNNKKWGGAAKSNSIKIISTYPARGEIFDREGKLMVCNELVYDLLVTPKYINKNFDVEGFCRLINMDTATFMEKLAKCRKYSNYKPSVMVSQISKEDVSVIQETLYKYEGIDVIARSVRKYPFSNGALFLGDVGETDADFLSKHKEYQLGDYRGIRGLENTYEQVLRGSKGKRMIVVNSRNIEVESFNNGENDVPAVQGSDLILEVDNDLQLYGEQLMANKRGSVVAINPKTGGILAMVSAPTFDPNLLVGRERSANYLKLLRDTAQRPLLNRAVMGEYPPGSTFKTFNALVALQEDVITEYTKFVCNGPTSYPIKCTHNHETPLNVISALRESCNPFFRIAFENLISHYGNTHQGFTVWKNYTSEFGFGKRFKTDIFSERSGFIPDTSYYNRYYGRKGWKSSTIRSLSIGQGEILVTPIQLANLAAVIANEGYYLKPHFVHAIIDPVTKDTTYPFEKERVETDIQPYNYKIVKQGMLEVIKRGTGRVFGQIDSLDVCGKTGTAQNAGNNHAIFMGFAPMNDPEIAIAVIVENAGYGATYAVPIATLMIEKFINDTISQKRIWIENRVLETVLVNK